jgi:hypothetical protein
MGGTLFVTPNLMRSAMLRNQLRVKSISCTAALVAPLLLGACEGMPTITVWPDRPAPAPSPTPRQMSGPPKLWLWDRPHPESTLALMPNVVECVRVDCLHWRHPNTSWPKRPEEVAQDCVAEIQRRGLRTEDIAVILQDFAGDKYGSGVFYNPRDAVDVENGYHTPWTAAGVAEYRQWLSRFCAAWVATGAPAPSRFFFDSEPPVSRSGALDGRGKVSSTAWMRSLIAMQNDPRWTRERLAGSNRTMAEAWQAAGPIRFDPNQGVYRPTNKAFREWYAKLVWNAYNGAMHELYKMITARWPDCRCTNFGDDASPVLYGPADRVGDRIDADTWQAPWIELPTLNMAAATAPPEEVRSVINLAVERGVDEFIVWWDHRRKGIHDNKMNFDLLASFVRNATERSSAPD